MGRLVISTCRRKGQGGVDDGVSHQRTPRTERHRHQLERRRFPVCTQRERCHARKHERMGTLFSQALLRMSRRRQVRDKGQRDNQARIHSLAVCKICVGKHSYQTLRNRRYRQTDSLGIHLRQRGDGDGDDYQPLCRQLHHHSHPAILHLARKKDCDHGKQERAKVGHQHRRGDLQSAGGHRGI